MILYVLDGLNGPVDLVDTFKSVIWNVQYYGFSEFELVVPGTPANIQKFKMDRYLVRDSDMSGGTYKNVMVIESVVLSFTVDDGWILTLSGRGLKSIVSRRVIWQQNNLKGRVENGIRKVITDNIVSPSVAARKISNFILEAKKGFTETFDTQLLGENIGEWLVEILPTYTIGWDVYISGGKYVFSLMKGTDRTYDQNSVVPVVFSPEFDNLISSTYTYAKGEYKNAALVGGEGEGVNQRVASVGTASGLKRYEDYIDGSGVSSNGEIITLSTYMQMLRDYGKEQIAATQYNESFEGSVIPDGLYDYGVDYFLGDLVQIENENGISAVTRITEIIYSEDENGWALTPTFSSWTESED